MIFVIHEFIKIVLSLFFLLALYLRHHIVQSDLVNIVEEKRMTNVTLLLLRSEENENIMSNG